MSTGATTSSPSNRPSTPVACGASTFTANGGTGGQHEAPSPVCPAAQVGGSHPGSLRGGAPRVDAPGSRVGSVESPARALQVPEPRGQAGVPRERPTGHLGLAGGGNDPVGLSSAEPG